MAIDHYTIRNSRKGERSNSIASDQVKSLQESMNIPPAPAREPELTITSEVPTDRWRIKPKIVLIVIGAMVLACVTLAVVLILASAIPVLQTMSREGDNISGTIEAFMLAGERNDSQAAYGQFSSSAGTDVTPTSVEDLINNQRDLFEGYESVKLQNFQINAGTKGTTARVDGAIHYASRTPVQFTGSLNRESGQWKLININFLEGVGQ